MSRLERQCPDSYDSADRSVLVCQPHSCLPLPHPNLCHPLSLPCLVEYQLILWIARFCRTKGCHTQRKLSRIATKLRKFFPSKVSCYTIACVKSCLPSFVPDSLSPSHVASPLLAFPLIFISSLLVSQTALTRERCTILGRVSQLAVAPPTATNGKHT